MSEDDAIIGEFAAAWRKMRDSGWDSLSPRERAAIEGGTELLKRLNNSSGFQRVLDSLIAQSEQPETMAGLKVFESLSPEDQERFRDWTPAQLRAVISVLDLKDIEEGPRSAWWS
jgi:hypothetical protein